MGSSLYKDFKDLKDRKEGKEDKDQKEYVEVYKPRIPWDPIGPVKYDVADKLIQSYLEALPEVGHRIDAIEQHLEKASGEPFVRPTERPDVGGEVYGDMAKAVNLLSDRLSRLEEKLGN